MLKQQRYSKIAQNVRWQQPELTRYKMPRRLRAPMQIKGSLTQFIEKSAQQTMHVRILSQAWQLPLPYERRALKLKQRKLAWIRQVLLRVGNEDWVYARSVVPMAALQGQWKMLQHLHTRPLGSLLFKRKKTRRGVIKVGQDTVSSCSEYIIWGRFSCFSQTERGIAKKMLVSEYFLEDFLSTCQDKNHA